jgi:4-hydroxy-tetrahydrodipicolinate synthase
MWRIGCDRVVVVEGRFADFAPHLPDNSTDGTADVARQHGAEVIEAVGAAELGVYLYHFPQMSGIGISLALIERLMKAYPGTIRGLKDSSGNWDYSRDVITSFPEIAVYSGSESLLALNAATGGAG